MGKTTSERPASSSVNCSNNDVLAMDDVLLDIEVLLKRFLCNEFEGVMSELNSQKERHIYYHFLRSYVSTCKGLVTFEEDTLELGLSACHEALAAANSRRRGRSGLVRLVWSPQYDELSEDEAHAEIIYATISAFIAILTLIVEKSLIGLVKAAYRLKSAHDALKESEAISAQRTNWSSSLSRETFKNGTHILKGVFVLVTSHLPSRVLKLVQVLGFDGSRRSAMSDLEGALNANQVWSPMAALVLLTYNTQIEYVIGLGEGNMVLVKDILDKYLVKFEKSGFFTLFAGLYEQIRGRPSKAIETFESSLDSFEQWPQLQNACYWFMIWCHATLGHWDEAADYAELMSKVCKWSPCTSSYQYAACLAMKFDEPDEQFSDEEKVQVRSQVRELLVRAPKLKHNVAGKTIFVEKFVTKRCELFFKDTETLTLPVLELFMLWNIFPMMRNSPDCLMRFKASVDTKLRQFEAKDVTATSETLHYLKFMRGVILRHLSCPQEAEKELLFVVKSKNVLHCHLAPQACLELGLIYKELGELSEAKKWLEKARSDYAHYLNETLVHLRAHCALVAIKERERAKGRKSISLLGNTLPPPSYVRDK